MIFGGASQPLMHVLNVIYFIPNRPTEVTTKGTCDWQLLNHRHSASGFRVNHDMLSNDSNRQHST